MEMVETKPDKQPIGKYADAKPFTTHQVHLNLGDGLYIFTDGYSDQFGGPSGKKFKAASLKKILLSIQGKNMDDQKSILNQAFEDWRGTLEQVDDVCIIGVKI
jgi:serine phosphatase RsbU (regulator of sigma subunit)